MLVARLVGGVQAVEGRREDGGDDPRREPLASVAAPFSSLESDSPGT